MGSRKKSPPIAAVGTADLIPCPEYTGDGPFFQEFLLIFFSGGQEAQFFL